MKYINSLNINDHKKKNTYSITILIVWYAFNFGPNSKKNTPQKHCGVWQWGKFEQFQHQIPKGSLVVNVI
jgi:hypothetical protein